MLNCEQTRQYSFPYLFHLLLIHAEGNFEYWMGFFCSPDRVAADHLTLS